MTYDVRHCCNNCCSSQIPMRHSSCLGGYAIPTDSGSTGSSLPSQRICPHQGVTAYGLHDTGYHPKKAIAGECLLFHMIREHLSDDWTVYYEPQIAGHRPGYIVIDPGLELLLLEVTDYTENTLYELIPDEYAL